MNTPEYAALLALLPVPLQAWVGDAEGALLEVQLDLGYPPVIVDRRGLTFTPLDPVTSEDLQRAWAGTVTTGHATRAGVLNTLHRVAAIRQLDGKIAGLTLRVGRMVPGAVSQALEQAVHHSKQGVLLVGPPGSGKTTVLRELSRRLSLTYRQRVMIVDTSGELAGSGSTPHPAVGRARRLWVPQPSLRAAVMLEAVENHNPQLVVVDELSGSVEVNAALTTVERGVRLLASVHGTTLRSVVRNLVLNPLLGGVTSVTLGDTLATQRGGNKTVLERRTPSAFDLVVELTKDGPKIYEHVEQAVDDLLYEGAQ